MCPQAAPFLLPAIRIHCSILGLDLYHIEVLVKHLSCTLKSLAILKTLSAVRPDPSSTPGRLWMRKQFPELDDAIAVEDDFRFIQVSRVDLAHELPAASTRGKDGAILENGNDLRDALFASGDHGRDRSMFGAETDAARHVHTYPNVNVSLLADKRRADITDRESVRDLARIHNRSRFPDEFFVFHLLLILQPNAYKPRRREP